MPMRPVVPATLAAALLLLVAPREASAQHEGHAMRDSVQRTRATDAWHFMAQAIPVLTHAAHTVVASDRTEAALAQTAAMARGAMFGGRLRLAATLDGEGLTMRGGELSTGAFGEGYVDRRHPHTYLHELVATGVGRLGPVALSASAGRGFAPFGTDDPMMRPFEKYPINHHLAQVLERPLVIGAVRWRGAILEGGSFGGDEPSSPSSWPRWRRFGDSWSVRGTLIPLHALELQGSYARVASPEQREGFGLDQRKRSVSARWLSATGDRYLLAEWARTVERDRARDLDAFGYESALAEGALAIGPLGLALRLEQTERPEEERLADPFRTPRPATDLTISGITRWRAATAALTLPGATLGPLRGYPFVEVERLTARPRAATDIFDPARFYGSDAPWMATVGVRLRLGAPHARMGRYGVAQPDAVPIRALAPGESAHAAMLHH
jgi:hypothetical protein